MSIVYTIMLIFYSNLINIFIIYLHFFFFVDESVYDSLMKKSLVAASRGRISSSAGSNLRDDENDVLSSVSCHLESTELWSKFHELGTEMIITKTGR